MSGRNNVVPMTTAAPPAASAMTYPWPMPPGGFPAGCCPPGGMDALLQCYCDIQAATAFISKVVTDLAANDPAFQKALVDGIAASGSNLPLIGVTNGADAQPGQVGEWVMLSSSFAVTGAANQAVILTLGSLPPGDWDIWMFGNMPGGLSGMDMELNPVPAGFTGSLGTILGTVGGGDFFSLVSTQERALTSVPSLIAASVTVNTGGPGAAGTAGIFFKSRRRR